MMIKALAADCAAEIKKLLAAGETEFEHLLEEFHLKAKAFEEKDAPKLAADAHAIANDLEKTAVDVAGAVEHALAPDAAHETAAPAAEPAQAPEGASQK